MSKNSNVNRQDIRTSDFSFVLLRVAPAIALIIGVLTWNGAVGAAQKLNIQDTKNKKRYKTILFLGNSLTAGYGIGAQDAFPQLIQQRIDSLGLRYRVINAGLSGETTAGGLRRIDWLLRQPIDIFVLELGGNDALRGIDLNVTRKNLKQIVQKVRAKNPGVKIVIAGMQAPPNLGGAYARQFRAIYPALAREADAALVPFLLADVAGIAELNLADRIHPNRTGHEIVATNVWNVLKTVIGN